MSKIGHRQRRRASRARSSRHVAIEDLARHKPQRMRNRTRRGAARRRHRLAAGAETSAAAAADRPRASPESSAREGASRRWEPDDSNGGTIAPLAIACPVQSTRVPEDSRHRARWPACRHEGWWRQAPADQQNTSPNGIGTCGALPIWLCDDPPSARYPRRARALAIARLSLGRPLPG